MSNTKTHLTWNQIAKDSKDLALRLYDSEIKFDTVIGIANGGMIPATLIAKQLKINKLFSANLKSYQEDAPRNGEHNTTDVVKVISFPSSINMQESKNVLVVDDLADTGLTLQKVKDVAKFYDCSWTFATLYVKPKTCFKPDYTIRSFFNDEWIVFPWEIN